MRYYGAGIRRQACTFDRSGLSPDLSCGAESVLDGSVLDLQYCLLDQRQALVVQRSAVRLEVLDLELALLAEIEIDGTVLQYGTNAFSLLVVVNNSNPVADEELHYYNLEAVRSDPLTGRYESPRAQATLSLAQLKDWSGVPRSSASRILQALNDDAQFFFLLNSTSLVQAELLRGRFCFVRVLPLPFEVLSVQIASGSLVLVGSSKLQRIALRDLAHANEFQAVPLYNYSLVVTPSSLGVSASRYGFLYAAARSAAHKLVWLVYRLDELVVNELYSVL